MLFTKPMQPCNAKLEKIKFPAITQPKIDGMKLVIKLGEGAVKVLSRSMKPVANQWLIEQVQEMFKPVARYSCVIEAEAQNGGRFSNSKGLVSAKYREFDELKIHVFDVISDIISMGYSKRCVMMVELLEEIVDPRVVMVNSATVHDHDELADVCAQNSQDPSLDGTIVRQSDSPYKAGKRTATEGYVVKIKNEADMEVTIEGFAELMHNNNEGHTNELGRTQRSTAKDGLVGGDTLGAFLCKTADGKDVRVGSLQDVTKEERKALWDRREELVGQLIKIKYMSLSEYGVPLHPVFIGFRSPLDLDAA